MYNEHEAVNKAVKVIDSCQTPAQLDTACRFAYRAMRPLTQNSMQYHEANFRLGIAHLKALQRVRIV